MKKLSKFKKNPPPMTNREKLFRWTVDIHNSVNRDNGKMEISYEEAERQINKNANAEPKVYSNYMVTGVAFSVSLITMICLFGYSVRGSFKFQAFSFKETEDEEATSSKAGTFVPLLRSGHAKSASRL
jgi:hypothetical protein